MAAGGQRTALRGSPPHPRAAVPSGGTRTGEGEVHSLTSSQSTSRIASSRAHDVELERARVSGDARRSTSVRHDRRPRLGGAARARAGVAKVNVRPSRTSRFRVARCSSSAPAKWARLPPGSPLPRAGGATAMSLQRRRVNSIEKEPAATAADY